MPCTMVLADSVHSGKNHLESMKIEQLHIGQQLLHPQYGTGTVRALNTNVAEIEFQDGVRSMDPSLAGLEPVAATATLSGLQRPLDQIIAEIVEATVSELALEARRRTARTGKALGQGPYGHAPARHHASDQRSAPGCLLQ